MPSGVAIDFPHRLHELVEPVPPFARKLSPQVHVLLLQGLKMPAIFRQSGRM
jgi:hypothetical protein